MYDAKGRLTTHAPATYKIPVASDVPPVFNTRLHMRPNATASIYRSKAVGEPPLMLGIAVYSAILDAVHAVKPAASRSSRRPARRSRSSTRSARWRSGISEGVRFGRFAFSRCGNTGRSALIATPWIKWRRKLAQCWHSAVSSRRSRPRARRAGDAGAGPGIEPARSGRAHGRAPVRRLPRHDRRRRAGMGGAGRGAGGLASRPGARPSGARWRSGRNSRNAAAAASSGGSRLSIARDVECASRRSRRRRSADAAVVAASVGRGRMSAPRSCWRRSAARI